MPSPGKTKVYELNTTDGFEVDGVQVIDEDGDFVGAMNPADPSVFSNTLTVGVDDTGYDVKFFGATTGKSWLWDESQDKMIVTGTSTFTGAVQVTGAMTCGVDGTGHDVQYFGDTASSYMLWDESANNLLLVGTAGLSVTSPTGSGIGYGTGAGGAVTQITSRSTGVTLNKLTGAITTDTTSLAAGAAATFTVTNSTVAIGDVVLISVRSGLTTVQTHVYVSAVAAGSFNITVDNNHAATAETGAIVINYAVIKAVSV